MKKTKLLLALALVFAALSFGLKANAQSTVPVRLDYSGQYQYDVGFSVYLYNNTTNDNYYFITGSRSSYGDWYLGSVPPGNYAVYIRLNSWRNELWLDWSMKNLSGDNVLINAYQDYELTTDIDINDDWYNNDVGLNIALTDF